jgi:hypothetical protein
MKYKKTQKNEIDQKDTAEQKLMSLLDKICLAVNIHISDWDLDKELFIALMGSPSEKLRKCEHILEEYDKYYQLLKDLNISVDPKYRWFTNIKEHIQ